MHKICIVSILFAVQFLPAACSVETVLSGRDSAAGSVSIQPYPVGNDEPYPHYLAFHITPPWDQEGAWLLRAPETLGSDRGLLFIDHHRPDMLPVTLPVAPVRWEVVEPQGALFAAVKLDIGAAMFVKVIPHERDVELWAQVVNLTGDPLTNLGTQFCLIQRDVKGFEDPTAERTFILVDGQFVPLARTRPGLPDKQPPLFIVTNTRDRKPWDPLLIERSWAAREQADIPLIATVSEDGRRVIGLAFDNAYKIMTNCGIPCIHADPQFADCPDGETREIRGRIYFVEGTLRDLLPLFERDFAR